jgi:DNA-binding MarR family transcriptional regulator
VLSNHHPDDPLLRLASEVRLTAQQLSRRVRFEGTSDVAPHQFSVLIKLRQRSRTPGELADLERVSAPSMTRTVNGLVTAGYVTKSEHPTDGRQKVLTLTASGIELVERVIHDRDSWMLRRLAGLTEADRATLTAAVEILNRVLSQ